MQSNIDAEVFETTTGKAWLREDGILMVVVKHQAEIKLEDAKSNIELGKKLTKGKIIGLCINMRQIRYIDREARSYYSSSENNNIKAIGVIVDSFLSRVIANFFVAIYKPKKPVKLFTSEEKATEWLKRFIKKK